MSAARKLSKEVFQARARTFNATTIEQQATLVGISRQHLHRLFNGEVSPNIATLDRIAAALDMRVDDFFLPGRES